MEETSFTPGTNLLLRAGNRVSFHVDFLLQLAIGKKTRVKREIVIRSALKIKANRVIKIVDSVYGLKISDLCIAAYYGNIEVGAYILNNYQSFDVKFSLGSRSFAITSSVNRYDVNKAIIDAMNIASKCNLNFAIWLDNREWSRFRSPDNTNEIYSFCVSAALSKGCSNLMSIHRLGFPLSSAVIDAALTTTSVDSISYCIENRVSVTKESVFNAALQGDFECLQICLTQYLKTNETIEYDKLITCCAGTGSLDCVIYLEKKAINERKSSFERPEHHAQFRRSLISEETLLGSAMSGNFVCFRYLFDINSHVSEDLFLAAAESGNIEIVTFLYKENCPFNLSTILIRSIEIKNEDLLMFFLQKKAPITSELFDAAACLEDSYFLELLFNQYNASKKSSGVTNEGTPIEDAESNQRPWSYTALCNAIMKNRIENIKFFMDKGCEFHPKIFFSAITHGDLKILDYLFSLSKHIIPDYFSCAIRSGRLSVLEYIYKLWIELKPEEKQTPWTDEIIATAKSQRNHKIIKFMKERGAMFDIDNNLYPSV